MSKVRSRMFEEKKELRIPGPTPVPPRVTRAMSRPIVGHRSAEFQAVLKEVNERVGPLFGTDGDVVVFTSSGTGGMEAAVTNTVAPGERMLVGSVGVFGDRWAKIGSAFGARVETVSVEWGHALDPSLLEARLSSDPGVKAVFVTHNETSTGVANDLAAIGEVVKEYDSLYVVDAISALGAMEMQMDEWNIDVVVAGSQKALMLPPGLALVAASERAWDVIGRSSGPRFYFDLIAMRELSRKGQTAFTPAVSLVLGLRESLLMIEEEGLSAVYARHGLMKRMVRAALGTLGLDFFAAREEIASDTITSLRSPEGADVERLRKVLDSEHGTVVAGGQGRLKGGIFRIGHMGYMDPIDVLSTISAVELGLATIGYPVDLGSGVGAAEEVLVGEGSRK